MNGIADARPVIAWHYTRGAKLPAILAEGALRPATAFVPRGERPVVWFSLNSRFEPTALPGVQEKLNVNGFRVATLSEAFELGNGLYRFGAPPRSLLTGEALRRAARISNQTWRKLVRAGAVQGADPQQWFGHIGPIRIEYLQLQRLTEVGGIWVDHAITEGVMP